MDPIGGLVGWIAVYGAGGLFAVALAERFVPMVPSHALLLAVGVSVADDVRLLTSAVVATTFGSALGCMACFFAVRALGPARATRLLAGTGRIFGMSPDGMEHKLAALRRNRTALAFSAQLVPTARLLAPSLAGLIEGGSGQFLAASAAGIAIWNGLFIGLGYAASRATGEINATSLALGALGILLVAQGSLFFVIRRRRIRRSLAARLRETG
ncbi:LPXTG cell wall anchor domain-containing protein [Aurantimonas sp. 22II-16-19i]|uniref:DedA family protein n=1 Tax=Aurantimonas sp. 22II-16-19i TaxID=1317114 RepID=UPI0009F80106|nr:LPXTG cell wall anchor domain-containing protein [Aurantimonas sp. 22II-16-19i]ORE97515.1 putative membrane-associated protein [Aurantimonas sp. 22II-16-19i]